MIVALAGRRIDPLDAPHPRFPLQNVGLVRDRLRKLFAGWGGQTLVCSAACGADLIALETAGALAWRRRVILPFPRDRFLVTSVSDRPGDWEHLYDQVLNTLEPTGDLLIEPAAPGVDSYESVSLSILDEAVRLSEASGVPRSAVLVWDGIDSGPDDMTYWFATAARDRGIDVLQVSTLE